MTNLKETVSQLSTLRSSINAQNVEVSLLIESIRNKEEQEKDLFYAALEAFIVELNHEIAEKGFILQGKQLLQLENSTYQRIKHAPCISVVGLAPYRLLSFDGDLSFSDKLQYLVENEGMLRSAAMHWGEEFFEYHKKCQRLFATIKELFTQEVVENNWVSELTQLEFVFYPTTVSFAFTENIELRYKGRGVHLIELTTYKQYLHEEFRLDNYMERLRRSIKEHVKRYGA